MRPIERAKPEDGRRGVGGGEDVRGGGVVTEASRAPSERERDDVALPARGELNGDHGVLGGFSFASFVAKDSNGATFSFEVSPCTPLP